MIILSWILAGLVVGLLAGRLATGYGLLEDTIVGVVGSIVGGWLFLALTGTPVTALNPGGLVTALVGSALFITLARKLARDHTAI